MDDVRRDARPAPQHRPPSHHRPRHAGNPARRDGLAGGWRTPGDAVPGRCIGVPRAGAGHGSASPGTGPGRRPAHRPRRPCATMRPVPVRRAGLLRTIPDGTLHPQCHGPPTVPSTVAAACPSLGVRMTDHRASVAERVTRFPVARGVDRIHGLQAATSRPSGTGWHAWACTSSTCATTARRRTWRMPTRRSAAPAAWVPRWPPPGPASSTASPRQSLASSSACRRCCTAAARRVRRTSRGRRCARRRAGCASPASSGRVAGRSSPRRRSRAPPPARSSTARCARACGMRRPRRRRPGRRTRARRRSPD